MAITPGTIAVTEGAGKTLDTAAVTVSAVLVQREIVCIGSPDASTPTQYVGVTAAGNLQVDASGVTIPVSQSGTWTVRNQDGSGNSLTSTTGSLDVNLKTSSITLPVSLTSTTITGTVAATQSGNWITRVVGNTGVVLDAAQAATSPANQLAVGGVFLTTPPTLTNNQAQALQMDNVGNLLVNVKANSFGTLTVSGTVTANQGGAPWSQNLTQLNSVALGSPAAYGTSPGAINVVGVNAFVTNTVAVSGTITANAGTNLNTSLLALDTSVAGILVSQASTTSGEKGPLIQGAVTTNAPSYTTAQTDPLSLDTAGLLRVSIKDTPANTNNFNVNIAASAATVTVSGTVTTTPPSNATTNVTQFGGVNISTGTGASGTGIPRVTVSNDSNILATQSGTWSVRAQDGSGTALTSTGSALDVNLKTSSITLPVSLTSTTITGTVAVTQSTSPWIVAGNNSDNTSNSTAKVSVLNARANVSNPSWFENNQVPLSVDLFGNLRTSLLSVGGASVGLDGTGNGVLDQMLFELRALRTAVVSMVTENGSSVESDFDPQNVDFQRAI